MRQLTFHWSGNVPSSGEALPSGAYAVSIPGVGIHTPRGLLSTPDGQTLLYVRLAEDGVTCAGSGAADDLAWEWRAGRWIAHGPAFGPKAVIYVGTTLHVVRESWAGPIGYRYVRPDGVIVTAADSYADVARGVFEYTDFGDVAIGQGDDAVGGGVVVRFVATADGKPDGALRRLTYADLRDHGRLRDLTVQRDGNDFAITVVDYEQHLTTVTWATFAELRALPYVNAAPIPDKDDPMPVQWPLAPNMKSTVEQVMREHPEIDFEDEQDRKRGLPHIVKRLNKPGQTKPWGLKATKKDLSDYNTDAINFLRPDNLMEIIDVFAGGKAAWITAKSKTPTQQGKNGWWMPAPDPGDDHEPEPDEPDEPQPTGTLDALVARVEALERTALRSGSRVALRTDNKHYLTAEGGGGGDVNATRLSPSSWETFTLEEP
jgi:hypothetical protein